MTPDSTRRQALADYRQSLILALRLKDVSGDRIGEIVAEVESHVVDTGEAPTEAFGSARSYAAQVTVAHRREPWWRLALGTALPAAVAGWFGGQGALTVLLGTTYLGQSGWLSLAFGVLVGIPVAVSVHRSSSRIRDPRTGVDMMPASSTGVAALIGLPLALILVAWAAIEIADRLS